MISWLWQAVAGVLFLAVLGIGANDYLVHKDLETRTAQLGAANLGIDVAKAANDSNQETIATCQAANAANATAAATAQLAASGALATLTAIRDKLSAAEAAARTRETAIYANSPTARAWGDAPVPDDLSAELRQRSGP